MSVKDQRLTGSACISRTLNLGRHNSIRIELTASFYLDEFTHEEQLAILNGKIAKAVKDMGLVERHD